MARASYLVSARAMAPVTAAWLERVTTHYLDRYGASSEMLRRVLARRIERRCRSRTAAEEAAPREPAHDFATIAAILETDCDSASSASLSSLICARGISV